MICSAPDLGRVPGRTAEMTRIRHAFCAAPGSVLLSGAVVGSGAVVSDSILGTGESVGRDERVEGEVRGRADLMENRDPR